MNITKPEMSVIPGGNSLAKIKKMNTASSTNTINIINIINAMVSFITSIVISIGHLVVVEIPTIFLFCPC